MHVRNLKINELLRRFFRPPIGGWDLQAMSTHFQAMNQLEATLRNSLDKASIAFLPDVHTFEGFEYKKEKKPKAEEDEVWGEWDEEEDLPLNYDLILSAPKIPTAPEIGPITAAMRKLYDDGEVKYRI